MLPLYDASYDTPAHIHVHHCIIRSRIYLPWYLLLHTRGKKQHNHRERSAKGGKRGSTRRAARGGRQLRVEARQGGWLTRTVALNNCDTKSKSRQNSSIVGSTELAPSTCTFTLDWVRENTEREEKEVTHFTIYSEGTIMCARVVCLTMKALFVYTKRHN